MKILEKYLSFWQDGCTIDQFKNWCGDSQAPFKKSIRIYAKNKGYKSVLDCGAGVYSEYYGFKEDGYSVEYTAIEITPSYIEFGLENDIKVLNCSVDDMPFDEKKFDCCLCLDVLNHQYDYRQAIKEMLRVTKKEVIISFFKPFEEDAKLNAYYSGNYKLENTPLGLIEHRMVDTEGETTCIYNFINKKKMIEFLDGLEIKYNFGLASDSKVILFLQHDK